MIGLLLLALSPPPALAGPASDRPMPRRLEIDALVGLRVGGGVLATVEPLRFVETGGYLYVASDFYSMAPDWVRDGLDPKHNLRIAPLGVVGVNTGGEVFQAALLGAVGVELLSFKESKSIPALDEPVVYGTTELAPTGGAALDLRLQPYEHLGFNLLTYIPLPLTATGFFNIERAHFGLGGTWRW